MKSINLIMKVTSNCTLACDYCYYRSCLSDSNKNLVMSEEVLCKSISQIMLLPLQKREIVWHGGEPLLAGKEFFKKIVYFQKQNSKKDKKVTNSIQTNATLLDQEWINFFKENNFSVGISLDGPKEIHDTHRLYLSKKGSFDDVMKALDLLRKNKIEFGVLSVLTKGNIDKVSEIYNFFINHNLKEFDILPCVEINIDTGEIIGLSITSSEFATFMIKLFDIWIKNDDPNIQIRYLNNILTGFLGGKPALCKFAGACDFITIDCNGDIYPCDNFIGYNEFKFGNILDNDLQTIINGNKYKEFVKKVNLANPECLNCEWYKICRGGCSYNRYMSRRDFSSKDYFCEAKKKIFKHIEKKLKKIINEK